MSWVVVGVAAVGMLQGAANQKQNKRNQEYRAETIKYSPWTGMGDPGAEEKPGALEMGLQGAAMGASAKGMMGGGQQGMQLGQGTPTTMNTAQPELYNPYMTMQA